MRFRPKTRRNMAIAFAAIVIFVMVVPPLSRPSPACRRGAGTRPRRARRRPSRSTPRRLPLGVALAARLLPNQRIIVGAAAAGGDPAYLDRRGHRPDPASRLHPPERRRWTQLVGRAGALRRETGTVDLSVAVKPSLIEEAGETHSHGPEGEHSHAGTAFTTWLSPDILRTQARDALALATMKPSQEPAVESALAKINGRVFLALVLRAAAAKQPVWLASHPVYQTLAQAGGTKIESMHWSGASRCKIRVFPVHQGICAVRGWALRFKPLLTNWALGSARSHSSIIFWAKASHSFLPGAGLAKGSRRIALCQGIEAHAVSDLTSPRRRAWGN
jgi:hypothetical protein